MGKAAQSKISAGLHVLLGDVECELPCRPVSSIVLIEGEDPSIVGE